MINRMIDIEFTPCSQYNAIINQAEQFYLCIYQRVLCYIGLDFDIFRNTWDDST